MRRKILILTTSILTSLGLFAQAPTMNCPGNTIVSNDPGACGATVTWTAPTCATNCTGTTIYRSDATGLLSGDYMPVGTVDVEYTITNGTDSTTCTFKVEVQDVEDPVVTFPSAVDVYVDGNCEYTLPYFPTEGLGTFTDNCVIDTIIQTPGPGTLFLIFGSTFFLI